MLRLEFYSPEGLRMDGRRWNELRSFRCKIGTHPTLADGLAYVEQGNSKVMCLVEGPLEPEKLSQMDRERATIEVLLLVAPFSTTERKKRQRGEKRIQELTTALERTFGQSVITKLYPRTLIRVRLQVLAQDGGLLALCVNAVTLALVDAGIAMYDYISGVAAGLYDTTALLDLNALEEGEMSTLTVGVVGTSEKLALLMLENKMPMDKVEEVVAIAIAGAHLIRSTMDDEVRRSGQRRLQTQALGAV